MMTIEAQIKEMETRIRENKKELARLKDKTIRAMAPQGIRGGTSWQDYDCIRGSRKEVDLFDFAEKMERLEMIIEIDEEILERLKASLGVEDAIKGLRTTKEKVKYLWRLGYTNGEMADLLYVTEVQICRLKRKLREEEEC